MGIKKGFTLAEVMITLGVLGVLAAILIPAVMNVNPNTNKVMFKKAYTILEKAVNDLIGNDTYYPSYVTAQLNGLDTPLGLSYSTIDPVDNIPAGNDKFCYLFSQAVNTVGTVDCTFSASPNATPPSFTTSDGILWYLVKPSFNSNFSTTVVIIDTNGNKPPNCGQTQRGRPMQGCSAGKNPDIYSFMITYNGKISTSVDSNAQSILADPTNNK